MPSLPMLNGLAVITRELRAESRRPANFWLRLLAAGSLIAVFGAFVFSVDIDLSQLGSMLFDVLKTTLLLAFWIIIPLMTADCVSREKREGTLGLLFLTPLTALDIIAGKAAVHILRAITLFLAALPILGLPFVFGGVATQAFWIALVELSAAVLLGIAAGIYASTRGGTTTQVMVMAEGYAFLLGVAWFSWFALSGGGMARAKGAFMFNAVTSVLAACLIFRLMLNASVKQLLDKWQEQEETEEQPKWTDEFARSEFWQAFFQWDQRRTLDRNPIAWLQEYSWTARLTKWGWFGGLTLLELIFLAGPFYGSQMILTGALAAGIAFSAVGSFRREQKAGLLELLLVTPLSVHQVINGRLWGIFAHFFPAVTVLLVGWYGDQRLSPRLYHDSLTNFVVPNPLAFVLLMIVGFYLSLSRLPFLLAWLLTLVVAFIAVPIAVAILTAAGHALPRLIPIAVQLALALAAFLLLYRDVKLRRFLRPDNP